MKVSKLLEQHFLDADSEGDEIGLSRNFGDTYLCCKNTVFRNIRKETLRLGYSFNYEQNNDYVALPLSQLAVILTSRKIPYIDNVSVLESIEAQIPDLANWTDIRDNLKKNFVFHESCHAVAREIAVGADKILDMLIEESFANTCELLAVVDAEQNAHKIFFEWNSYSALHEARTNLKNAMEEIGRTAFFKFIFFGYLHSNYMQSGIDEIQFARIARLVPEVKLTSKQLKTLRALLKICFTLDFDFKEVTTGFYMKLRGVDADRRVLAGQNFLERFEKNYAYAKYVDRLFQVVTAG